MHNQLNYASFMRKVKTIKYLLSNRADKNAKTQIGTTPYLADEEIKRIPRIKIQKNIHETTTGKSLKTIKSCVFTCYVIYMSDID